MLRMKIHGGGLEPTPKQRQGSGLGGESPERLPVLSPSDQNSTFRSLVLAVTSERRQTPSRTHKYKPESLSHVHITPGGGRAGAQNRWQEGGPKGTRKREYKAGVTAHLGVSGDAATCSLQPSPAEVPGGGPKGLRGWKGAPVLFWVARFSRRLTSTWTPRVHFRHRAVHTGLPSVYGPGGPLCPVPVPPTGKQGPLAPLRRPRLPCAPAALGRIREGPVEGTFARRRTYLGVEGAATRQRLLALAPKGARPAQEESRVCVWWRGGGGR